MDYSESSQDTELKCKVTDDNDECSNSHEKRTRYEYDNEDIRKLATSCNLLIRDKQEREKQTQTHEKQTEKLIHNANQWREFYLNSERKRKKIEADLDKRNEE